MSVETPEGPNIGLINSLATYARTTSRLLEKPVPPLRDAQITERDHLPVCDRRIRVTLIAQASAQSVEEPAADR